jgi:hypothetical protein
MKHRGVSVAALLLALVAGETDAPCAAPKPVLVHYMPWFVAEPYSSSWGWHWTMNYFNPNATNSSGEREIASWYYPLIGPYDSLDPVVLEYHVLLMKLAGIDGVIVDWYGMDNFNDYAVNNQRTAALFNYTRSAGLKFSLCYEDSTIQQEINGGFIAATGAIAHAQQTMLYAQSNYFGDPSYLRWNSQPVLLNFGPQYFKTNSQWASIFSVLSGGNFPAFFTEDNRLLVGAGAFDWPPMYLSQSNNGVLTLSTTALDNYLANFQQTGSQWPAYLSSAFPRFHDIYAQAGVGPSYGYLADSNGATMQYTLGVAMTNGSAFIQVVTWNDFGEGTIIEPTVDYGYRDLGTIQDYRRQYLDPGFPWTTNDLALAYQVYAMRRAYASNPIANSELNQVFTNIIGSNLTTASLRLTGLESNRPVIYNPSYNHGQLQFGIGGYVSSAGVRVQTATNLVSAGWQTVQTLAGGTNPIWFSTSVAGLSTVTFFRIQNAGP